MSLALGKWLRLGTLTPASTAAYPSGTSIEASAETCRALAPGPVGPGGSGERARDRLLGGDTQRPEDADLVAELLFPQQRDRRSRAEALVREAGGLAALFSLDGASLQRLGGIGPARASRLLAARELARRAAEEPLRASSVLNSPARTRRFLQQHLAGQPREIFCCLFLDAQHRLRCCEDLFYGTLDGAAVYPREVLVAALRHRAAAVILAHNHPSGVASPSTADRQITERLVAALALVDVRVLDHLIVGRGACYSFAEHGLL